MRVVLRTARRVSTVGAALRSLPRCSFPSVLLAGADRAVVLDRLPELFAVLPSISAATGEFELLTFGGDHVGCTGVEVCDGILGSTLSRTEPGAEPGA
jgi:hypothetical protein